MRKFKTMIPIVAAMLIVALLAVACSPSNVTEDNDTINAYFGALEAKTFNADDWTITSTGSLSNSLASVSASNFYWAYKATKQDDGNTTGQTEGFVNVVDGTGLNKSLTLSKGKWIFELKAYGSSESRATAISGGTDNYIYSGTSAELEFKTSGNIDVPLVYSTAEGNGKVSFNITATLSLDDVATEKGFTIEKIVAKLTPITGSTEKEITLTANGSNYTGSASDVPNGFYKVTCQIYIDGGVVDEKELSKLIVYKDMESAMSCTSEVTIKEETVSASLNDINISAPTVVEDYGKYVVGETFSMGKDPNTENAISWRILAIDEINKRMLVISANTLKTLPVYQGATSDNYQEYLPYKWSTCYIKEYLNSDFITEYCLEDVSMVSVEHITEAGTSNQPEETTNEKVFLLSKTEAETYFSSKKDRSLYNSWVLRTPCPTNGTAENQIYTVSCSGEIAAYTQIHQAPYIRPAFWMSIE